MTQTANHIPHLDGLRAIAVLSVFLFHLNHSYLPAGFFGVDVFFVISGYIITKLILRERQQNRFSFGQFYIRRIVRIIPAQIVTVIGFGAVFYFLLPPDKFEDVAASAIYSIFSAANVFFYFQDGYFGADSSQMPFLHMWSLGVEEQFYVIWPLTLILLYGLRRYYFAGAILFISILSYAASIYLTEVDPNAAFYLPFARVFQFGAGALLVILAGNYSANTVPDHERTSTHGLLFCLSVVALISACYYQNPMWQVPGFVAIAPTLAAVLVIYTGFNAPAKLTWVLTNRLSLFLGKISYSLYLVHWPVVLLADRAFPDSRVYSELLAVALTFVLAVALHLLVEQPLRYWNRARSLGVTCAMVMLAAFAFANLWAEHSRVAGNGGVINIVSDEIQFDEEMDWSPVTRPPPDLEPGSACPKRIVLGMLKQTDCDLDVLIMGDSHAEPARVFFAGLFPDDIVSANWQAGCAPVENVSSIFETRTDGTVKQGPTNQCTRRNQGWVEEVIQANIRTIVIAARWDLYTEDNDEMMGWTQGTRIGELGTSVPYQEPRGVLMDRLEKTIVRLEENGIRVILFGQVPISMGRHFHCIRANGPRARCAITDPQLVRDRTSFARRFVAENPELLSPNFLFFDPYPFMCLSDRCPLTFGGVLLYRDLNHLNVNGVRYLAAHTPVQIIREFVWRGPRPESAEPSAP